MKLDSCRSTTTHPQPHRTENRSDIIAAVSDAQGIYPTLAQCSYVNVCMYV